jgi:hypothetical protein
VKESGQRRPAPAAQGQYPRQGHPGVQSTELFYDVMKSDLVCLPAIQELL